MGSECFTCLVEWFAYAVVGPSHLPVSVLPSRSPSSTTPTPLYLSIASIPLILTRLLVKTGRFSSYHVLVSIVNSFGLVRSPISNRSQPASTFFNQHSLDCTLSPPLRHVPLANCATGYQKLPHNGATRKIPVAGEQKSRSLSTPISRTCLRC